MTKKCEFCSEKANGSYYLTTAFKTFKTLCYECSKKYAWSAYQPLKERENNV